MNKNINNKHHIPVLLYESIENIINDKSGIYLDITFGGGGHSREILKKINYNGKLIAIDCDINAIKNNTIKDKRLVLFHENFTNLEQIFRKYYTKIDGIIGDLGLSSYQLNDYNRGFSINSKQNDLDMRMDKNKNKIKASHIINNYSKKELSNILINYGDIKNPYKIINNILYKRKIKKITTIHEFISATNIKNRRLLIKIFQAIRIEVNNELNNLLFFLKNCFKILKKNAKIAIISYHSKEDKIVKQIFKNTKYKLKQINKKVIKPNYNEIKNNPKSKSAKLRIAKKYV